MYIADTLNHRIRMLKGGVVTTFAGDGTVGLHDGPPATAQFNAPLGLAQLANDPTDALYVADTNNHSIRKIARDAQGQLQVTTIAGDGEGG